MATNRDSDHAQRIRIKNRRKVYLDRHPDYFKSPELELAGATRTATSALAPLIRYKLT